MRRVLVTGVTGFVGAILARRLLREGHEVHALVRREHNPWRIHAIRKGLHLHEAELDNRESLNRIVNSISPDWVFHLATNGGYSWQTDLQQMVQTNVIGTMNLVEACLKTGFEAFVNSGSSSEYGFKDHAPSETEFLEPNSYYAVTKASATLFCRHTAQSRRVHMPTLRLYSVYGPYEQPNRFIPTLIARGRKGALPLLVGPDTARDYVYVEDVIDAYLLAAELPAQDFGAVYNVGTGFQTSIREVVEIARRLMSIQAEPNWDSMPPRLWDTNTWVADNRKITNELGWKPHFSFEEGLRATIQWFHDDPAICELYDRSQAY